MKKNKLIFLLFIFILAFGAIGFASAELEINYPGLGKYDVTLPTFIEYLFKTGIAIVGVLALISFALGAVQYIISADNAEATSNAKDRMKGAILGIILTGASVILIQTINPQIATVVFDEVRPVLGIYYTGGAGEAVAHPENPNTDTILKDYNNIKYICIDDKSPNLLIWFYPKVDYKGTGDHFEGVNVTKLACGEETGIAGKSFKMAYEAPGVYFYLGEGCTGHSSQVMRTNRDKIDDDFMKRIKSIRIINSSAVSYGTILHEQIGLENGGLCTRPIKESKCHNIVGINVSSANIFILNKEPFGSGDGVDFFSAPYGWNTGANAGSFKLNSNAISENYDNFSGDVMYDPEEMCFDYKNVKRPEEYKNKCFSSNCWETNYVCDEDDDCEDGESCDLEINRCVDKETGSALCSNTACETFQDCPGSIKIKGRYLVALYSVDEALLDKDNEISYCQTFSWNISGDVENLKVEPFLASGNNILKEIYIIPIKDNASY